MALPFLEVIAREALYEIFQQGSLINTVTRDFEGAAATQGESVTIIMPETPSVQNAGGAFAADAVNPSTVTLMLDRWRETKPMAVDLKTIALADRPVLAMYAKPIAEAIRLDLEASILAELVKFTGSIGDPAGTKAPSGIAQVAVEPKAKFDVLLAPADSRFVIAGPTLEKAYFETFGLQSQAGDTAVAEAIRGTMGQKMGMTFISDNGVESGARIGVGYHRNAIALATRPMKTSDLAPNTMTTVQYGGLGITMEAWHSPETSKDYVRAQILYGLKALTSKGFLYNKQA